ncbi:MAG TPA: class I tRNA ligase family protein [Candidatus Dormibacteraeota bacterium]|nr:class I tRNA ligase family protein [Candidatus Dormibacteraeota bacterium]
MSPASGCTIRVFDSLSRQVIPLPLSEDGGHPGGRTLKLYVCGVTPYDSGHMGHAFTFCAFDLLVRWAEASGVRVRYVQNVTDVDDPLFERARRDGVGWKELADREVGRLLEDMRALGWRPPDVMPRVSAEIPAILAAVDRLVERGFAYQTDALYYAAGRYPDYGGLSHLSRRSMLRKLRDEGLLGEVGPGAKRDPLDFPLWRRSAPDEPSWPSRYGEGRPGWHIECSAMSMRYLGDQVDVHGGGRDLCFSHHESERAQSESLTGCVPFSRAWMHTGMVRYRGHKMSKSLGNLVVVPEALARVPAAALRLYLVAHRYRRDWSFRWEGLVGAARLIAEAAELLRRRGALDPGGRVRPFDAAKAGGRRGAPQEAAPDLVARFSAAMDDDLDTPRAVRALRAAVRRADAAGAGWMLRILCGEAALT